MADTDPTCGRTHTWAMERAATAALTANQAEKTPSSPQKGFYPPLGATAISIACALPWGPAPRMHPAAAVGCCFHHMNTSVLR